jgi:ADP-ribose pyrophosphatase YjhB (NUDIX family)
MKTPEGVFFLAGVIAIRSRYTRAMTTDYTNARSAPVITIFVLYRGKYLMVKRSDKVLTYQGLWSCLAGFVDDDKTPEEKAYIELEEELGVKREEVKRLVPVDTYLFVDKELNREWIRHVYLAEITNPTVDLSWEHTQLVWVTPDEAKQYESTPGFHDDLAKVMTHEHAV